MKKITAIFAFIVCFTSLAMAGEGLVLPSASYVAKQIVNPIGLTKLVNEGTVELTKRTIRGTKIVNQQIINGTKIVTQQTINGTRLVNEGTVELTKQTINGTKTINQQTVNPTENIVAGEEQKNTQQQAVNQVKTQGLKAARDSQQAARDNLQVLRGLGNVKIR